MIQYIKIKGAKENNLKNIDLEIPRDKLCGLSPSDNVDKIGLLLFLVFGILSIDRERERRNRNSSCGLFQLGISGEPACKNNLVQIKATHFSSSAITL